MNAPKQYSYNGEIVWCQQTGEPEAHVDDIGIWKASAGDIVMNRWNVPTTLEIGDWKVLGSDGLLDIVADEAFQRTIGATKPLIVGTDPASPEGDRTGGVILIRIAAQYCTVADILRGADKINGYFSNQHSAESADLKEITVRIADGCVELRKAF